MLVEIQYPDHNGSVCPFCGVDHFQREALKGHQFLGYKVRMYACRCPSEHLFFVSVETIQTHDDYRIFSRMFVHYQDWEEHIDLSITPGPFEIPHLDDEDDAWQIHLLALESYTQDQK